MDDSARRWPRTHRQRSQNSDLKLNNTIINTSGRNYALLLACVRRQQYIRRYNNKINSAVTNVELDE